MKVYKTPSYNCGHCFTHQINNNDKELAQIDYDDTENHYSRHMQRETRSIANLPKFVRSVDCKCCRLHLKKGRTLAYFDENEDRVSLARHYTKHITVDKYRRLKERNKDLKRELNSSNDDEFGELEAL